MAKRPVFISADNSGIKPSNKDQGYVLRRLIRRMIRHAKKLNIDINSNWEQELAVLIINKYSKSFSSWIQSFGSSLCKRSKNTFELLILSL